MALESGRPLSRCLAAPGDDWASAVRQPQGGASPSPWGEGEGQMTAVVVRNEDQPAPAEVKDNLPPSWFSPPRASQMKEFPRMAFDIHSIIPREAG